METFPGSGGRRFSSEKFWRRPASSAVESLDVPGANANIRLLSDARCIGPHGIGRFAREVLDRLPVQKRITSGPKPYTVADPFWQSLQILRYRPDVYFSPGYNPPFHCRSPFIFTIHDLIHLQIPEEVSAAKRLYYQYVVLPAAWRASCVLTVSEFSRGEILRWAKLPEDRVVVVGNGVSDAFYPDGPRREFGWPYLLYVGCDRPHKNLDRLLGAFSKIDDSQLRLVLTGPPSQRILEKVKNTSIGNRVVFSGTLTDSEMASLYHGARLLVLPSTLEGFGMPALEAMACGTPVVAARNSSIPEIVGDAGVLFDPFDEVDIRHALELVLGSGDLRVRLKVAGLQRASRFTWEGVAQRTFGAIMVACNRS